MNGQRKRRRPVVWLAAILFCLGAALGLGLFKYRQIQSAMAFAAAFPEPVETVEAFTAREALWRPTSRVTGEVVAMRSVTIQAEVAGTIVEVGVAPGARVVPGQVLVRLDTSEESANLAAAQAEAEIARLDLMRAERLLEANLGAIDARDQARARFEAAQAVARRIAAIIEKKTLRAPFAAVAGLHELARGQFLDKGGEVVRLIGSDDLVWVDFTLPQEKATLAIGESVDLYRHEGTVHVHSGQAFSGKAARAIAGKIVARDSFVNERSRNVRYRSRVQKNDFDAAPGSIVIVDAPIGPPLGATLVPANAVRRDAFGAKLFVLRPAEEGARARERAERREVKLGPRRGELIVIASGLAPGERVAADGAFKLRDGVLVNAARVSNWSTANAPLSPDLTDRADAGGGQ